MKFKTGADEYVPRPAVLRLRAETLELLKLRLEVDQARLLAKTIKEARERLGSGRPLSDSDTADLLIGLLQQEVMNHEHDP